ncbi:MAG: AbrB/MazE/SpoVT family DNA-binding domain-containing protein [Candidatus Woesearchaeota archaeon]
MKRKVIQVADKTLMISLPLAWVKQHDIKKGDEIEVDEAGENLLLYPGDSTQSKLITIDISFLNERVIRWYLSALHKSGFDEISIKYHNPEQLKLIYSLMKNLFTGFNIISETDNSVVLKNISKDNKDEFDQALRRAFRVTISMGKELLDCINNKDFVKLGMITEKELLNNQLTNFCERLLNKYKFSDKTTFLYTIIWNLEKVCDNYKYIIDEINNWIKSYGNAININVSDDVLNVFNSINLYLEQYYNLYYNFNIELMNKITDMNKSIKQNISMIDKNDKFNLIIINHLNVLLTQTTDFSASIIALNC